MKRYVYIAAVLGLACERPAPVTPDVAITAPTATPTANIEVDPATITHDGDALPIEIAVSDYQICLRIEGKVHCGNGDDREKSLSAIPAVAGIQNATALAMGTNFGCAIANGGQVWCWGQNGNGELGAESAEQYSDKAVRAKGIDKAKRIFAGYSHVCAVLEGGDVKCWGLNREGQTGGDTFYESAANALVVPKKVMGVEGATSGDGDTNATCVSTKNKDVWCWGESIFQDQADQLGETNERPWKAKALAGIDGISGADRAFCGIKASGASSEVLCWGESYGLFNGYGGKTRDPRSIKIPEPKKVRLSSQHACALAADGRVFCWGTPYSGALGRDFDERTMNSGQAMTPEAIADIRAVDISVGGSMSCATTRDYEIFCWGRWPYTGGQRTEKTPVAMKIR